VQRFTPLLADAARFCRHSPGDRWFVDETYIKVHGAWRYVYRAVDQYGQVIDVLVSARRDADADGLVLDVRSNDGPGSTTVIAHRACLADRIRPENQGERARALTVGKDHGTRPSNAAGETGAAGSGQQP
jgi:hypothetical protein